MGYKLNIDKPNGVNIFYGTKLYGYYDPTELDSFKYLVKLNKCNKAQRFGYGMDIKIELTHKEFVKFITLYVEDFKKLEGDINFNLFNKVPELKECLNYQGNVIISWD